ncbi:MAG TPA: hypothetical protein VIA45_04025 [Thermoanaerobaculia bacterium]
MPNRFLPNLVLLPFGGGEPDRDDVVHRCDTSGGRFSSRDFGDRTGDAIPFEFPCEDGRFDNTFIWNREAASWTSLVEKSGEDGKRVPIAQDMYRRP